MTLLRKVVFHAWCMPWSTLVWRRLGAGWMVLALLGGCQKRESNFTVLLDWSENPHHIGLFVAQDKGFYQKYGLDVAFVMASAGLSENLLWAGKADVAVSSSEELIYATKRGMPMVSIATLLQEHSSGLMVFGTQYQNVQELDGLRYGAWGSPTESAMIHAFFPHAKQVNIGEVDLFSVRSQVDFAWVFAGWTLQEAKLRGIAVQFFPLQSLDIRLGAYTPILITKKQTLNSTAVQNFLRATKEGYLYSAAHPREAQAILLKQNPTLSKDLVEASLWYLAPRFGDQQTWGHQKLSVWEAYLDWMQEKGLISNYRAQDYFTNLPILDATP